MNERELPLNRIKPQAFNSIKPAISVLWNKKAREQTLWRPLSLYELTRLAVGLGLSHPNLFRYSPQGSFEPKFGFPVFLYARIVAKRAR